MAKQKVTFDFIVGDADRSIFSRDHSVIVNLPDGVSTISEQDLLQSIIQRYKIDPKASIQIVDSADYRDDLYPEHQAALPDEKGQVSLEHRMFRTLSILVDTMPESMNYAQRERFLGSPTPESKPALDSTEVTKPKHG